MQEFCVEYLHMNPSCGTRHKSCPKCCHIHAQGGWIPIAIPSLNYAARGMYTAEYTGCPQKKVTIRQSCHKYCPKCCHIHAQVAGYTLLYWAPTKQQKEYIPRNIWKQSKGKYLQICPNTLSFCMRAWQTSSYSPGTLLNPIGCWRLSCPRPQIQGEPCSAFLRICIQFVFVCVFLCFYLYMQVKCNAIFVYLHFWICSRPLFLGEAYSALYPICIKFVTRFSRKILGQDSVML